MATPRRTGQGRRLKLDILRNDGQELYLGRNVLGLFPMQEEDDDAEAADPLADPTLRAWLDGRDFEYVTRYVQRGRCYSILSDGLLIEAWVVNMKQHCRHLGDRDAYDVQIDLDAEIGLRGLAMPCARVATELEVRRQHLIQLVEEMKKNGKEWDDLNAALEQDFLDFFAAMEKESETFN
jgi:hypothetical protein